MTHRTMLFLLVVVGSALTANVCAGDAQIQASTSEAATPWTGLAANDAEDDFSFVLVSDRTGGHRSGVFASALPKVNLLRPAFVLSVGDLIEGYTDDPVRLGAEWDEVQGFVAQLEAPFFYVPGNHDMSNAVMSQTWRERFGPSYYHFTYKGVLFLVLNSELFGMVGDPETPIPGPWQQSEQMNFVSQVLQDYAHARWTVVIIHQPLWDSDTINTDWLKVESMLGDRAYTVFAGHHHRYLRALRHDRKYITLATTGGSSALRGPLFGEFDHVALVSMTAAGPTIANLTLDGILPDDVTTEASRAELHELMGSVQADIRFIGGSQFRGGEVSYRIANNGAAPLTATPFVTGNDMLRLDGEVGAVRLAPGEQRQVSLRFSTPRTAEFARLVPARVAWSLVSRINQQATEVELQTAALPLTQFPLRQVSESVAVDGNLAEWQLPYVVTRQGDITTTQVDPLDISYRFGVGYDDELFYLAAAVRDDSIVTSAERSLLGQDGLVVSVDARPNPERSQNESISAAVNNGNISRMVLDVLTLEPPARDPMFGFLDAVRSRLVTGVRRTDAGYAVELGVPVALLNAWQGQDWQVLRLGLHANDFDEGERGSRALHWQPNRFGSAPVPGSGTFVRH